MPAKRLNYFHYQFLQEQDFSDEQQYHLSMRRRHNQGYHTWGRVQGLEVTFAPGARKVTISPGMAVDGGGREIIVESNQEVDLQSYAGQSVYLVLLYKEAQTDPTTQAGVSGNTRITESFQTKVYSAASAPAWDTSLELILAKIALNAAPPASDGAVTSAVTSERTEAGAKIGQSAFPGLKLMVPTHGAPEWPEIEGVELTSPGSGLQGIAVTAARTTFSANVVVNGDLTVKGDTTLLKSEKTQGNSILGDQDSDTVTIEGSLVTGHSSGRLKINSPVDLSGTLSVAGGDLKLESGHELLFADNGQLRSLDNNHRILFRRLENKLEFREYGDLVFSPGAITGVETAKVVMLGNGNVGIGTDRPNFKLDVKADKRIKLGLEAMGGGQLQIACNSNDNSIWLEAYNAAGSGDAAEFLLTGMNGGNVPKLRLHADITHIAGSVGIGTTDPTGRLDVRGDIRAGNSDIYFTKTDHSHTGIGNASGFAAIENAAAPYNALMILGRTTPPSNQRIVKLWDFLQVNGTLEVTGEMNCPRFKVTRVLSQAGGPLPGAGLNGSFSSGGGTLVVFAFGSGYSAVPGRIIGMQINVDTLMMGVAKVFTNEAASHKSFVGTPIVITSIGAGNHTLSVYRMNPDTQTDGNDFFDVTVLELPFR
jgi:hypothetical protein